MSDTKLTEGQVIMGVNFNPSKRPEVDFIKQWCADQYDQLKVMERDKVSHPEVITDSERVWNIKYCVNNALKHLEDFQMVAVDAVTCTDDMSHDTEPIAFVSPTPGERAMKSLFNYGNDERVATIKTAAAHMYDTLNQFSVKRSKWLTAKQNLGASEPQMRLAERDVEDMVNNVKFAQRQLQMYKLYAVKAVTR